MSVGFQASPSGVAISLFSPVLNRGETARRPFLAIQKGDLGVQFFAVLNCGEGVPVFSRFLIGNLGD